jgi:hypothetical protein
MSDANPEVDEIPLTPKDRAAVNAAITYGTPSEAADHFAEAERWAEAARQAGA